MHQCVRYVLIVGCFALLVCNGVANKEGDDETTQMAKEEESVSSQNVTVMQQNQNVVTLPTTLSSTALAMTNVTQSSDNATTSKTSGSEIVKETYHFEASDAWKPGTFKRMLYVLVGISSVVILYFIIKAVRLRSRTSRVRQYGMLSRNNKQDVEMSPLNSAGEDDDGDEDTTLFDKSLTTTR